MQENQLDRIYLIISEFREDIIQIQKFLEDSNVEESSPVFDNTTLFDEKIDTFGQEQESFITNFFKALSISVLLGEYIFIADFFKKLNEIEEKIKILPTSGGFLSSWRVPQIQKISEQIIEISSVITIAIECYKDFYKHIENAYSDNKKDFIFEINSTLIRKQNQKDLVSDNKKLISYFENILKVNSIDHFLSSKKESIIEILNIEFYFKLSSPISFRDISNIVSQKLNFLKYKWKQRQEVEISYLEDGTHKELNTQNFSSQKLKEWSDVIDIQYEYQRNWEKSIINRVRDFLRIENLKENTLKIIIHQLIKYYKDIVPDYEKGYQIADFLAKNRKQSGKYNYNIYVEDIFCNYALNNAFSCFVEQETNIETIFSKYYETEKKLTPITRNYFLKYKLLNKVFELLLQKYKKVNKENFISEYQGYLDKCKDILTSYKEHKDWSLENFNYIYLLPYNESLVDFEIEGKNFSIFFASSFVLPPSHLEIETHYKEIEEKYNKLNSYLEFTLFFNNETREIKEIKKNITSFSDNQTKEINEIRESVKETDKRSIETLTIFTAIISFIIGNVALFQFIKTFIDAIIFILIYAIALSIFVLLIFVSTKGVEKIKSYKKILICFYAVSILLLGGLFCLRYHFEENETKEVEELKKKIEGIEELKKRIENIETRQKPALEKTIDKKTTIISDTIN
jgi:hypothetical protein